MDIETGSDTGFGSDDSSDDDVVEEWRDGSSKRKHSDEEEEVENLVSPSQKKNKRQKESDAEKPPTAEELNRLRETENLFHSNLFRLQVEEMLKEVQVKQKHQKEFQKWFNNFRERVLKLEDENPTYNIQNEDWLRKLKIKLPISQIPIPTKGVYSFRKPTRVEIIGSYAMDFVLGPKTTVDVLIETPRTFYHKDDYLNSQYHRKRAMYLSELVHYLQDMPDLVEDVHFIVDEVDILRPKAEIIPFGKIGKYMNVVIHLVPAANTFKLNRFSPIQNNVRSKWFFNDKTSLKDLECPTTFYNNSIVSDLTAYGNHLYLMNNLNSFNNVKDGIKLLKVWLRQRESDVGLSNLNGFLLTMLVSYLLKIKKINSFMSSYQIFRIVCNYLCSADWTTNGVTLCEETDQNLPSMTEFHRHHSVVFVDITGYNNLCYGMSRADFKRIQHEAQLALNILNSQSTNSFQILFMTPVPFYRHYDQIISFHNEEALENIALIHSPEPKQLSYCGVTYPQIRELILEIIAKGLGKRISQFHVKQPSLIRWRASKRPHYATSLILGMNLNPEEYFTVLDKAGENEMDEFQNFWGSRSELRRFQDGTITEAVVWNAATFSEKRLICKDIVTYLMKLKFNYSDTDFNYLADQLNGYIPNDVEEQTSKLLSSFDRLAKKLRDLKDLPLDIINVQGTSPVNRYADVFPPAPFTRKNKKEEALQGKKLQVRASVNKKGLLPVYISPVDIIIQMGASSKWPHTLEGIRRIKAAFNIKLAESLKNQFNVTAQAFQDRVEVNQEGYVFRVKIFCPLEISLLQKSVDSYGMVSYKDTEESLQAEKETVYLPKLTSSLHGVYQEHNSYGPACCLVKRWVNSHLIDFSHMLEEALELLVASLYLNPGAHEVPLQPQVAFIRFLNLMATTNWNTDCIILNINNEFTKEDIAEVESEFNTRRAELPSIFISTPQSPKRSIWTIDSPTPLILLRLVQLSKNALDYVESQIYSKQIFDHKILFEPSYDVYDILIHLLPAFNLKQRKLNNKKSKGESEVCVSQIPVNGFDPVECYLKELRETFGEFALFFHDYYGGSVIGVVWKPDSLEPKEFKVSDIPCRKYDSKTKKLKFNSEMAVEDFKYIGEGIVKEIVQNKR